MTGGFSCFRGELRGIFCGEFRRFFRNSASRRCHFRRQIPASPLSFPRTRESIFADKFPSFPPLWKNEVNSQFCSSKWIPAFAGMTGGFSCFRGELRGIFCGEFRRFFRNSAPPPPDSRRQIPALPLSFPRTRESIFADKFPISRRFFRCTPIPFPANVLRCLANVLRGLRNVLRCLANVLTGLRNVLRCLANVLRGLRNVLRCLGNVLRGLRNVLRCLKNVLRGLRNVLRTLFFRRRSPKNAVFQRFTRFLAEPARFFVDSGGMCYTFADIFIREVNK